MVGSSYILIFLLAILLFFVIPAIIVAVSLIVSAIVRHNKEKKTIETYLKPKE